MSGRSIAARWYRRLMPFGFVAGAVIALIEGSTDAQRLRIVILYTLLVPALVILTVVTVIVRFHLLPEDNRLGSSSRNPGGCGAA